MMLTLFVKWIRLSFMLLYLKTIDILIEKIKQDIHWITEDELNKVIKLYDANTFTGWGRLSHKLLLDIKDSNDNNIMDLLWKTRKNFLQIISDEDFAEQINDIQEKVIAKRSLNDTFDAAYASPQTRKTLRQALAVVDEVKKDYEARTRIDFNHVIPH